MDGAGVARIAQWSAVGQVRRVWTAGGGRRRSDVCHHTEGHIRVPHRFEAQRGRLRGRGSFEDELAAMVVAGHRAAMLYLNRIGSTERFALARDIDPAYGLQFDLARARGVEALARRCRLCRDAIEVAEAIAIID